MRYQLIIKKHAEQDAIEAALWYNEQKQGLGNEFLLSLDSKLENIKNNPSIYAVKYRETRVAYTKRFPYGIHYKVEKERIFVLAILHTSRNPKIWEQRNDQ